MHTPSSSTHRLALCLVGMFVASAGPVDAQQTTFRVSELELRDPHAFAQVLVCLDITDLAVNAEVSDALNQDSDMDGSLDLNPLLIFDPLDQAGTGGTLLVHFGNCSPPAGNTSCVPDPSNPFDSVSYTNGAAGSCLSPLPGTVRPYNPPVAEPTAPCFVTEPFDAAFDLGGIELTLESTRFGATYVGDPATGLTDGLISGFLAEAVADTIILPPDLPFIGGQPFSSILAGGSGNCSSNDDRDLGPDGQTLGWWMYFNFEAVEVPFTGSTGVVDAASTPAATIALAPAVPNPFNPATTLTYDLTTDDGVRLSIIDASGRIVRTLVEGTPGAGRHTIDWDGRGERGQRVASGVYFARLVVGGQVVTRHVVLLK